MAKFTPRQLQERFQQLEARRQVWESHWQELADFIMPRKNEITQKLTPGSKRRPLLLDSTAMISNQLLSSALHSLLTNPFAKFFGLKTGNPELDSDPNVQAWFQDTVDRIHFVLNNTNFQTEIHECYLDLGAFGTSSMLIEEDPRDVVRFKSVFIENIFINENSAGRIDEVHRRFKWDVKNLIQEFGRDKLPKRVIEIADRDQQREFEVIHSVYPEDMEKIKAEPKFMSQYILPEFEFELRAKTFNEQPFVVSRWIKGSGEMYGRSPGMVALPEIKTLNKMVEVVIKGAQKVVDPPLQAPDDGYVFPIRTRPGSVNIRRAGSPDRIEPVFDNTRIDFGFQVMEERRVRVRQAFFIDQLQLREGDRMTTREVGQRTEEQMRLLAPILARQQSELLRPLVDRVFKIMLRKDLLAPIPEQLQDQSYDVEYTSLIARAQQVNEGNNIMRGLEASAGFMQLDPSGADNVDVDRAVRRVTDIYGWPKDLLRSAEEMGQIREARAQAQAQAQAVENAVKQADVVSKVGQVQQQQPGEGEVV